MTITRLANESLADYVTRLEAAVAAKPSVGRISFKVSEKGALSVYGMGRFPVTLYKEQWAKLAEMMPDVLAFAKQNDAKLKTKGDETTTPPATAPAATAPAADLPALVARTAAAVMPPATAPRGEVLPPSAPLPEVQQLLQ